jgi:hypothetical protein
MSSPEMIAALAAIPVGILAAIRIVMIIFRRRVPKRRQP